MVQEKYRAGIPIDGPLIQEFATKAADKHKVCGESADVRTRGDGFFVERAS